ncbi:hypothetical protein [Micromonospora carbonacea]|uniref:Peptidase inhibitor family I36 n=1 Tax=Micromonospora carbonacea TaxID=47853 RepID=A0A1C4ZW46_9ACTN|nr:hypothetical protein [Micromonospora carbonacea]MBB5826538.1 hypothetical protein [Micromonospora carbonacea]QLD26042.1 hypothetical protein HXZ27_19050 [Micromonospora carbonacea]SCF37071.1 hypothetical protein GA0070563_11054 [Micromonospora carbonacea]
MLLKSLAVAASAATLLATAPTASAAASQASEAWPPGNCAQGTFCVWPNWAHPNPAPVETPSLVSAGEWSGSVPAKTYYNYTPRNVDMKYSYTWPDGSTSHYTLCTPPGGNIFYLPVTVTQLSWHEGSC